MNSGNSGKWLSLSKDKSSFVIFNKGNLTVSSTNQTSKDSSHQIYSNQIYSPSLNQKSMTRVASGKLLKGETPMGQLSVTWVSTPLSIKQILMHSVIPSTFQVIVRIQETLWIWKATRIISSKGSLKNLLKSRFLRRTKRIRVYRIDHVQSR